MDSQPWDLAYRGHYLRVGFCSLLIWDYLLTFEDERTMFWNKPRNMTTYIFFWNRYVGVVLTVFGALAVRNVNIFLVSYLIPYRGLYVIYRCGIWFKIEAWLTVSASFSIQVILQLRIFALYGRSRRLAFFMITAFILEITTVLVMFGIESSELSAKSWNIPNIVTWCQPQSIPTWLPYFGLTILLFEATLSFFALLKTYQRFRDTGDLPLTSKNLFSLLLRDFNMYYLGILTVYVVNVTYWIIDMTRYMDVTAGPAVVLPSVLGSRLMLNVRLAYYKSLEPPPTNFESQYLHMPNFGGATESIELVCSRRASALPQ